MVSRHGRHGLLQSGCSDDNQARGLFAVARHLPTIMERRAELRSVICANSLRSSQFVCSRRLRGWPERCSKDCSPQDDFAGYDKKSGDLGAFILQQSPKFGARAQQTNGLPQLTADWRYKEDADGFQIYIVGDHFSQLQSRLTTILRHSRRKSASPAMVRFKFHVSLKTQGAAAVAQSALVRPLVWNHKSSSRQSQSEQGPQHRAKLRL